MSSLHNRINALAAEFAHALLRTLRTASLEDIIAETAVHRGEHRAHAAPKAKRARRRGRLHRRSSQDITAVLGRIVTLLHGHSKGLRAEQIREKLGLDVREMPRPIAEGLKKHQLSKRGKKRGATYFAGKTTK